MHSCNFPAPWCSHAQPVHLCRFFYVCFPDFFGGVEKLWEKASTQKCVTNMLSNQFNQIHIHISKIGCLNRLTSSWSDLARWPGAGHKGVVLIHVVLVTPQVALAELRNKMLPSPNHDPNIGRKKLKENRW